MRMALGGYRFDALCTRRMYVPSCGWCVRACGVLWVAGVRMCYAAGAYEWVRKYYNARNRARRIPGVPRSSHMLACVGVRLCCAAASRMQAPRNGCVNTTMHATEQVGGLRVPPGSEMLADSSKAQGTKLHCLTSASSKE